MPRTLLSPTFIVTLSAALAASCSQATSGGQGAAGMDTASAGATGGVSGGGAPTSSGGSSDAASPSASAGDTNESGKAGNEANGGAAGSAAGGAGANGGGRAGTGGTATTAGASGAGGGVSAGAGCAPGTLATSGTLMGPFGSSKVSAAGQEYFLQVNQWGVRSPAQLVTYGGDFFFKMTEQPVMRATDTGPTGYPSLFIGANSRNMTAQSGLPKAVSALSTVPTTFNWKDSGTLDDTTSNSYNVAYDVWFSTQAAGEPNSSGPSGGYLMVWLHDPPDAQPIGQVMDSGHAVTIPGADGKWDVWIGMNGTRPCISYVRTETTESLSFDLNAFIKDAVTSRPDTIQAGWYLTNVFVGFEIWRGGIGLEATNFCVKVN